MLVRSSLLELAHPGECHLEFAAPRHLCCRLVLMKSHHFLTWLGWWLFLLAGCAPTHTPMLFSWPHPDSVPALKVRILVTFEFVVFI